MLCRIIISYVDTLFFPRYLCFLFILGHNCPENVNPADFIIDVTSIDERSDELEAESIHRVDCITAAWSKLVQTGAFLETEHRSVPTSNEVMEIWKDEIEVDAVSCFALSTRTRPGASPFKQWQILVRRGWTNQLRDNLMLWGNLLEVIVAGIVFGAFFFRLGQELPDVLTRRGAIYTTASIQCYLQTIFVVYKTSSDMKVFDRERADKIYDVLPFVFGQFTAQLIFNILFPTIFATIMYFMIGLRGDDLGIHFFRFILANVLGNFVVVAQCLFAVSIARDFATSSLIVNLMFTFWSFSAGYFIQLDSIPPGLKWTTQVSYITWMFRLMASNEFSNNTYTCSALGSPCKGNDILSALSIPVDYYITPILGLIINFAAFMFIAILLLQFVAPKTTTHASPIKGGKVSDSIMQQNQTISIDITRKVNISLDHVALELETRKYSLSINGHKMETEVKTLLKDVSAEFRHSSLSIVMGGSGAGKSTLLSVLCGRPLRIGTLSKLSHSGRVLFNGAVVKNISTICSFVGQSDDHLLPALTCRETLLFAAKLRLPPAWSLDEKIQRADQILITLGLKHCADTIVGTELVKGLSGGEKRRLSIGLQMITDPSILVIDEPTSGLDAFTAQHIMLTLKKIARTGRTIICTIHQPRSDIFLMFDSILLLARGGRVAYSGPCVEIIPYFFQIGYSLPKFFNPADFILDITSVDFRSRLAEEKSMAQLNEIAQHWQSVQEKKVLEESSGGELDLTMGVKDSSARPKLPFLRALVLLTHRCFLNSIRQP